MNKKIRRVKAYTAAHDDQAKFPDKNFLDVIDKQLSNGSLLIGGGSIDISNLDTATDPAKNLQALSEKVLFSAHKLFSISEAVLRKFPSIRKVILMKRTPRYDPSSCDPLSLKPQLSSLADWASFSVWCESEFKDKIILGGQDIPSGDTEHTNVFGNPDDRIYDGVHMNGPAGKAFLTRSIQKVLMKAKLIDQNSEIYALEGWKERGWKESQTPLRNTKRLMNRQTVHHAQHRTKDDWSPSQTKDGMEALETRMYPLNNSLKK